MRITPPPPHTTFPCADPDFLHHLATHDAACPGCGYNLRALLSNTCPECGRSATLAELLSPNLPDGAYTIGFIGLALLACMILPAAGVFGEAPLLAIAVMASAPIPVYLWSDHETWIKTRPRALRILMTLVCWILPILACLLFAL